MNQKHPLRFKGSIWCNLDIASRHVDRIFRHQLQDTGLTVIEWYILRALYDQDGQYASKLAVAVGRAATSFTPNLDKLQQKGYVTRQLDPNDRRATCIYLTNYAQQQRDTLLELADNLDKQFESLFSREELRCLLQALKILQTAEID